MPHIPTWLSWLAAASLAAAGLCALLTVIDLVRRGGGSMWIMNLVWPLTMLWAGPAGFAFFRRVRATSGASRHGHHEPGTPFGRAVALGALHCGAGCTAGDILAELVVARHPVTIAGSGVLGTWTVDFVFAFVLGVVFQYFTIAPMRGLGLADGLRAAVAADAASLTAWQLGMYGMMALAIFTLFPPGALRESPVLFWFWMQLAMAAGFVTSFPVNWWLIRSGIKEAMAG
jgi:hypothetical protein